MRLPREAQAIFDRIVAHNHGKRRGCWDVFAWRDGEFVFVECKRSKRDRIQSSQVDWFGAALSAGVSSTAFVIVEWDFA